MSRSTCRFQPEHRLLKTSDFRHVFDKAFKVNNKAFTLLARKNHTNHSRLGLVIAKKNLKLAIQRNRVKRLLRDYFRCHKESFANYDLVVLTRREITVMSQQQLDVYRDDIFNRFIKRLN
ncbi:MAG: ribonuclease P protein component [Enterobacterales bacterium]|nr:ribonuclease P protein component [Enterobacterales bacterium]